MSQSKSSIRIELGFKCEYKVNSWQKAQNNLEKTDLMPLKISHRCTLFAENFASSLNGKGIMFIELKDGTVISDGDKGDVNFDMRLNMTTEHDMFMFGDFEGEFKSTINVDNIKKITLLDKVIYEV